jgi:adenosylcobinamide-phosphate synthase
MLSVQALLFAVIFDRFLGDPPVIWSRIPHPVVLFGKSIAAVEKGLNRHDLTSDAKRRNGVLAIASLLTLAAIGGVIIDALLASAGILGFVVLIAIVAIFLAQKSLADHVAAVATALKKDGLQGGRHAVSMVVGRDPNSLDEPAVCRAAIETLAENFSDGVIAPALYFGIFGLPGLFAYKMLNTADSMIGHKTDRYREFGWASARLDDLANWPAARLSAGLIAIGAWATKGAAAGRIAMAIAMRDHGLHRSPNSGWPESAMAGALDVALAGPRIYAGETVMEPMQNGAGARQISPSAIEHALKVYGAACTAFTVMIAAVAAMAAIS